MPNARSEGGEKKARPTSAGRAYANSGSQAEYCWMPKAAPSHGARESHVADRLLATGRQARRGRAKVEV